MAKLTFINSDMIVLCATNEGTLYKRHIEMAQSKVGITEWYEHIVNKVFPCLSGPSGGYLGEKLVALDLREAAIKLKDYYEIEIISA